MRQQLHAAAEGIRLEALNVHLHDKDRAGRLELGVECRDLDRLALDLLRVATVELHLRTDVKLFLAFAGALAARVPAHDDLGRLVAHALCDELYGRIECFERRNILREWLKCDCAVASLCRHAAK